MNRQKHRTRGAILVETALAFVALLGLYFAGFQVGMVSYYQLALDAGNQFNARATALGVPTDIANTEVAKNIPQTSFGSIRFPDPKLNSDSGNPLPYLGGNKNGVGYNGIDTLNVNYNFGSTSARWGGYTFTAPVPYVSVARAHNGFISLGNTQLTIASVAVEAQERALCPHFCLVSGGVEKATKQDSVDYFAAGDNTAPYFISWNYMLSCGTDPNYEFDHPSAGVKSPNYNWLTCPAGDWTWRALGTAAHLDSSNDMYTLKGETLGGYSGGDDPPGPGQAGPFYELWCHRNMFLKVEQEIGASDPTTAPTLPTGVKETEAMLYKWFGWTPATAGHYIYATHHNPATPFHSLIPYDGGWDSLQIAGNLVIAPDANAVPSPWIGCGAMAAIPGSS